MQPVPATKCRGRDEKCKKAKGKISNNLHDNQDRQARTGYDRAATRKVSNNLPDSQDRLLAYAGHRSGRDYVGRLSSRSPSLSMLADLIYWPARMISDFPDVLYPDGGGVFTGSAAKLANPRYLSTGSVVKGANPRNSATLPLITMNPQDPCLANVPADHWKGEYYDYFFYRYLAMVRDDGDGFLNFNWGTSTPSTTCPSGTPGMLGLNWDATWTRTVNFTHGLYRFTLTADDWAQLYVDGQVIIGDIQPANPADVFLSAGNHEVKLEYSNMFGVAMVNLSWVDTGCFVNVGANRWRGEYFNNTDLANNPVMVHDDGDGFLNFNWGGGSPGSTCGVNADNFSARWTRTVNFAEGTYRFTATVDNGVRLYIDDQLKIDQWGNLWPNTGTVDVPLSAGPHVIRLELVEYAGDASASLSWAAVCQANVSADRWRGEYYNNTNLEGNPVMVRNDGDGFLNFNWGGGSPNSACGVNADNFSARWTRTVNFASGVYRFTTTADNGVRLYVDGQLTEINQWAELPPSTYMADVALTAGNHEIKLEFVEYTGGASASLSWATLPAGDLNMALIDPINRIGLPGKDLLSRNCNWSLPLLSLPGRAGMDLGLALSLNSLIYTRAGSAIHFDPDQGDLARISH